MVEYKLSYLAELIDGKLIGEDIVVSGVASIEKARETDLSFLFQRQFLERAKSSPARAFVVLEGLVVEGKSSIVVKNPSLAQAKILRLFYPEKIEKAGISSKAFIAKSVVLAEDVVLMDYVYIDENVTIGKGTVIYPFVYIGKNVKIGKGVKIFPHAVVMDDTEISDNVIIYPGAVIGSDGFGYAFDGQRYIKIPQVGRVVIEEDVEIGANTTIDRATLDETRIGSGTKIDNLGMIAHNVSVGKNSIFAAQVGIAGSSKIGNYVVVGGKVGIKDHVTIGDGVLIGAMSGIMNNVEKDEKIAGIPATNYYKWLKIQAIIEKLPEIKKEIDKIIKAMEREDKE